MKPGVGPAHCLHDITDGVAIAAIRKRWKEGGYGPEGERPRGDYVAGWLAMHRNYKPKEA